MLVVRPGRLADLAQIEALARAAHPSPHALPPEREALAARLARSQASFNAQPALPGEEFYLFVLEDDAAGRLLGTASIAAAAGHGEPFYAFRNDALLHASRALQVHRSVHALSISHQLSGRSLLGGYAIAPALAGTPAAGLLARARLIFMAQQRQRFAPKVFTILRGVVDEAGVSPFWEAVGRKFFQRDLSTIERAADGRSNTFIAEIMPTYPLYVPLLPAAAQRVLGEPLPQAAAAYASYLEEGFQADGFVDIFDAGPVLTALLDLCATVRGSVLRPIARGARAGHAHAPAGAPHLLANGGSDDFRCVLADLSVPLPDTLVLPAAVADRLGLADGDAARCAPLAHESPGSTAR